jgi:hypothetical protein
LCYDDFQGANLRDIKVLKTNEQGITEWEKTFNESDLDVSREILLTPDSGYLLLGDVRTPKNGSDIFLAKLDKQGNTVWKKTYNGYGDDTGGSILMAADGNYIIVGIANHSGLINSGTLLIKVDKDGNTLWQNTFGRGVCVSYKTQLFTSKIKHYEKKYNRLSLCFIKLFCGLCKRSHSC